MARSVWFWVGVGCLVAFLACCGLSTMVCLFAYLLPLI